MKSNTLEEIRILTEIASMYYEEGAKQSEIGKKFNISRSLVSRYLTKARDMGIVEIVIHNEHLKEHYELEKMLEKHLGLCTVICVDSHSDRDIRRKRLVDAGNNYLLRMIKDDSTVAVTGGTTVNMMSKLITTSNRYPQLEFISMTGGLGGESKEIHANLICENFASRLGSKSVNLYAPALVDSIEARKIFIEQSFIKNVLNKAKQADIILTGVGGYPSYSTLASAYLPQIETDTKKGNDEIVGDFCYNFIDKDGNNVDCEWNERVITLDINHVKDIPLVIAVAEGEEKVDCIYGAIKSKLINSLITDEKTAELLLDKYKQDK